MRKRTLIFVLLLTSCSTPLTPRERYWELEADSKRVFIAYYPLLTSDQREELLLSGGSEATARSWVYENIRPSGAHASDIPHLMLHSDSYTLKDVKITGKPDDEPFKTGSDLKLHAEALYQDGRHADATEDVAWQVEPASLAQVSGQTLRFACVASDLVVGADFYHERQGTHTFHVRKPLASLELNIDGASLSFDHSEFLGLRLVAHCSDGTRSEVNCQAHWRSLSPAVQVHGCGDLTILSRERIDRDPVTVEATYGGVTITRAIQLSQLKR